jgi:hypothetical protein
MTVIDTAHHAPQAAFAAGFIWTSEGGSSAAWSLCNDAHAAAGDDDVNAALLSAYLEDYGLLLCSTYRQGAANSTGHSEQSCEWRVGPAYLNLCPRFQNGIISTAGQLN